MYGIIKQSKGYVWVESGEDRGTTFEILLPRSSRTRTEQRSPEVATIASGSETVLLVEDEDAVRALTGSILQEFGYRVLEAPSGREAMEICAAEGIAIADIPSYIPRNVITILRNVQKLTIYGNIVLKLNQLFFSISMHLLFRIIFHDQIGFQINIILEENQELFRIT